MGIARSAGRLVGKLVNPSWKPPKPKPAWHESNNKITNIVARHKRGTNDFIVDSKSNNEHDLYIVDHNPDKSSTKYKKIATVGNLTRIDTGNTRTRTQSENPINSENRGINFSGLDAVVEHLRSGGYDVHALNKGDNAKKPVFQGKMVHPLSRHSTTYADNRYENYFRLKPKSDEAKTNDRFWSTQNKPKPQVQKALEYNPSPPKAPPSNPEDGLPKVSDGNRHSQSDLLKWAKRMREEYLLKKGSSQSNERDVTTDVGNYLVKAPKNWPIYRTQTKPKKLKRPEKQNEPFINPTVTPANVEELIKPPEKSTSQSSPRTLQDNFDDAEFEVNVRDYLDPAQSPQNEISTKSKPTRAVNPPKKPAVKKNAPAPVELPAKAVELPTGKDHLDYIRGLVEESKGKAWRAGIANNNLRGSQNPTILDPETVKKLKNVEIPEFDALDFNPDSLTPEKLQELDNSMQARAIGESNRAAVASGNGITKGNIVDDVHKYLVPKAQGDDRIEGFQALADRLEALNDPNLSKVIVRLRTSQDNLASQREALANPNKKQARKEADALALELRRTLDPTGVGESSQIRNPKTGKPEAQVLPLEIPTEAGKDIKEAINQGTGQFNKNIVNTHGIGLNTLTVPTNLQNHDGSLREYTEENVPHYTAQLGRRVDDDYQSEQHFKNLAPDAELPVPTTPIDDFHHGIASLLARLAGLQASNSSMVDNNPNATSDRFAPATPGMIVQSTDSEGKTVSDKPIMNTEKMANARLHEMEKSVHSSEGDLYDSIRKNLAGTFNQEDADYLANLDPKKRAGLIKKMVDQQLNDTVRQHATNYANPEQDTSGETNIFTANGGVDPRDLIALADHYGSTGHKNPMTKAINHLLHGDPAAQNIIRNINAYDKASLENQFSIHQAELDKKSGDPATQNAAAGVFNHMNQQGLDTGSVGQGVSAEDQYAALHPETQQEIDRKDRLDKFATRPVIEKYVQIGSVPVDVPKVVIRSGLARRGNQPVVEQAAPSQPQADILDQVNSHIDPAADEVSINLTSLSQKEKLHNEVLNPTDFSKTVPVHASTMNTGDKFGDDLTVVNINDDGSVLMDGGKKYGQFKLEPDQVINYRPARLAKKDKSAPQGEEDHVPF